MRFPTFYANACVNVSVGWLISIAMHLGIMLTLASCAQKKCSYVLLNKMSDKRLISCVSSFSPGEHNFSWIP